MARTKLLAASFAAVLSLLSLEPAARAGWAGIVFDRRASAAKVQRVLPSSPAARAGLRRGDVITHVGGGAVASSAAVTRLTKAASPGKLLRLKITRRGRVMTKLLRIAKVPGRAKLLRLFWMNQWAPNFRANLVGGGKKALSDFRGKPVILFFWASWCGSCKINLPKVKRLYRAYAKKGLVVYSLSEDKRISKAQQTAQKYKLPFLVGHNKRKWVSRLYKLDKIPILIFVDRKGIVRDLLRGSSFGYGRLLQAYRRIK